MFGFKKNSFTKSEPALLQFNIGKAKPYALIIYVPWALAALKNNTYKEENFASHSMHWESIEMMQLLQAQGYNVHVADCTQPLPNINWQQYKLIFDERNNIYDSPEVAGQKKIHYATGCHWLVQNLGELQRIQAFRQRYQLVIPPIRQVPPLLAEATAHWVTYFGGPFQQQSFSHPQKTLALFQSCTFIPQPAVKNIAKSNNQFLWLGSAGMLHKGLDVVLEAFKALPQQHLHICTQMEAEPLFFQWFTTHFAGCENLHYHGWLNVPEAPFQTIANDCIGTVCVSVSEGGAGATVQAMQFGCIPICNDVVDDATFLKPAGTGLRLTGKTPEALLTALIEAIKLLDGFSESELQQMCTQSAAYAATHHSKAAFTQSFKNVLQQINA